MAGPNRPIRRRIIGLSLLMVLAAFAMACNALEADDGPPVVIVFSSPSPAASDAPVASPAPTAAIPTPSPTPTTPPLQVCSPNPDPVQPDLLWLDAPAPDARVKMPFQVTGWASNIGKDDAGLSVAMVDDDLNVVQFLNVPPQPRAFRAAPPGLQVNEFTRPFAADILIEGLTGPTPFCIWIFLETQPDGMPKGIMQVPVIVSP